MSGKFNCKIAQTNGKLRESFSKYKDEKVEKSEHENCKIPDMIYHTFFGDLDTALNNLY